MTEARREGGGEEKKYTMKEAKTTLLLGLVVKLRDTT